jgi:hypothetical protein
MIEAGRPREAEELLRRLARIWPEARWLQDAIEHLVQISAGSAGLRVGPLSLAGIGTTEAAAVRSPTPPPHIAGDDGLRGSPGRDNFVLHVDGVGSFLICTGAAVTLGAAGASRRVDVPLMVDAGAPIATFLRSEDDYFLRCPRPVPVNDVETANKLLRSGDRIGLGSRCRVTFRRPSSASGSAVLDLSAARMAGSSVRHVILMDREILIGPGVAAHVRADDLAAPVVLQFRDGTWSCKSAAEISVDDTPAGRAAEFPAGARVAVGPVRFVVVRQEQA